MKNHWKMAATVSIFTLTPLLGFLIFISYVTFPSWSGKSVNANFWQYQFDRNHEKLLFAWKINQKSLQYSLFAQLTL